MTQKSQAVNSHIEKYLDYYCGLCKPGFAILLKGKWGSGKTWFIKKYEEKLKEKKQRCLYVSLYGMTSFSDIENVFFEQLFPIRSSKIASLTGKILQGLIKASLKIDLNNDGKDDTVTLQIPTIQLPKSLENIDNSILIFDDLERCQIDIGSILGYINYFVEQQGLKVVIIANEDKLFENDKYKDIKEKLIGKTFDVYPDLENALEDFIKEIKNLDLQRFLSDNTELIDNLYRQAQYNNLRSLKQIILDFERIFQELSEKDKSKLELLQELFKTLMAFSIEVKSGIITPKDISYLFEKYQAELNEQARRENEEKNLLQVNKVSSLDAQEKKQKLNSITYISDKYKIFNLYLYSPFLGLQWWGKFFDKGIIDTEYLKKTILNSRYYQDENTPDWVKLYHYWNLSDNEFDNLLNNVKSKYNNREFTTFVEVKYVTGLFLTFSEAGLYDKTEQNLLEESKSYVNWLKDNKKLDLDPNCNSYSQKRQLLDGCVLGFAGLEINAFREFCSYAEEVIKSAIQENMPILGQELIDIMENDIWQFHKMICLNNFNDLTNGRDKTHQVYFQIPIFKYINPRDFVNRFLDISFDQQKICFYSLKKRFQFKEYNIKLLEELDFLKSIQKLLLLEANNRKGKISGYRLKFLLEQDLNDIFKELENLKGEISKA